ncbi:uncharacterized protein [Cicer arietinum]|uniref:uncharacterized protein n=1 Tax=Cicer arietinum TaxID=3827 RepID=UPI00032A8209
MHEYELFNMKKDEFVIDMQTIFTHIVNNLDALGKVIDNEQQISMVMRCLTREWQRKISAIAESKDLGSMSIATLFGKLREREIELHRLSEAEQTDRKRKGLSLKVQAHQTKSEQEICTDDSNSETDEDLEIGLLVRKFKKFVKKKDKDEEANLCLMANTDSDSDSELISTKKLLEVKCMLYEEIKLKHESLKDTNENLKKETYALKYDLEKFNSGKILGIGDIGNELTTVIKEVLYVKDLKHNLISISQLCDKGFQVCVTSQSCIIEHKENKDIRLVGDRINNIYMLDFNALPASTPCCLLFNSDENWLWHKKVAHIHMDHLNKLVSKQLVLGLPNRKFTKDKLCDSYEKSKLVKSSFPPIDLVQTNKVLQLIHMDLFGPSQVRSFEETCMVMC